MPPEGALAEGTHVMGSLDTPLTNYHVGTISFCNRILSLGVTPRPLSPLPHHSNLVTVAGWGFILKVVFATFALRAGESPQT